LTHVELLQFGERLRRRRNALSYTQENVAEQVDISLRFYQMLEQGQKSVSLDTLIRLSKALNLSVDYLLFGNLSYALADPSNGLLSGLTVHQRENAVRILQLYSDACSNQETT